MGLLNAHLVMNYKLNKTNIMKKVIIICITCIAAFSCKAQQIIDMSANNNMDGKYENATYYHKDVNNYLNDFTGTWKYEYDTNKEYRIILTKVEMYHVVNESLNFNYYRDGLLISYEKYENGTLVYQSPTFNYPTGAFDSSTKIGISFTDYGRLNAMFNLDLTLEEGSNDSLERDTKLRFNLSKWHAENLYHDQNPNEPYFSVPNDILMTKVE